MDLEKNQTRIGKIITIAAVILISALALYFRYEAFNGRPLWADELQQINSMGFSLLESISKGQTVYQFPGDIVLIYPFYKIFGLITRLANKPQRSLLTGNRAADLFANKVSNQKDTFKRPTG